MSVYNQPRKNVILLIFVGVIAVITLRLFFLQVVEKKYRLLARDQAIVRKVIYPNRGIVYDRRGKVILTNDVLYDLVVTPAAVKNIDTGYLCRLLDIDTAEFRKRMQKAIIKNSRYRQSVFAPLLPPEVYARLQENIYQFPGFELIERPVRSYPYKAAGPLLGYIGEVDSNILKRPLFAGYQMGDFMGITGLERSYEPILMGQRGIRYEVRDVRNRPMGSYEKGIYDTAAIAGKNLHLALDIELQQLGERLMQNKIGGIVAIDPQTGGVLALVSSPGFDPNLLRGADRGANFAKLYRDTTRPLFNRAIQAMYPPGSTFKPLDALVALDQDVITPGFGIGCAGVYYGCGRPIRCTEHWQGHSKDLRTAIAFSCNSYFSHVFRLIIDHPGNVAEGLLNWKRYMNSFGLGHKLGIDLPGEMGGYIPDTTRYNRIFGKNHWNSCTIVSLGIGQGEILETPLQIANTMCLIGNKGYYYTPHLVSSIEGDTSGYLKAYREKHQVTHIPNDIFETVIDGMQDVVEKGTARSARIDGITVCGKTGTAQNPHGKDHSLFAAFAPKDNPRIAIAVVVENAGFGATYAAPIGSLMIEKFLTDSIASKRLPVMERLLKANLIPKGLMKQTGLDTIQLKKATGKDQLTMNRIATLNKRR